MTKAKRKGKANSEQRVKAIPPSSQEARDEGPRLIPLRSLPEEPRVQRYLELADAALGKKTSKPKKPSRDRS